MNYEKLRPMKENFGSGPRIGNTNPSEKRKNFKEGKMERADLADQIKTAYAHHSWEKSNTKHDPQVEPIVEEIKLPKRFKKS